MNKFGLEKRLNLYGGILAVLLYCAFTFSSITFYPPPFSPLTHWLSDLGNPAKNPDGAILYNLGCILTGTALFPFFIGMNVYKVDFNRNLRKIVLICQIAGAIEAIALIGVGLFPGGVSDEINEMHMFFSNSVFYANMFVLIMMGFMLIKHPKTTVWIGIYNFSAAGINIIFLFTSIASELMEWMTVFTALAFVAVVAINAAVRITSNAKPV